MLVCESSTDVRLILGLALRVELTVLLRGSAATVNWPQSAAALIVGPRNRLLFVLFAVWYLLLRRSAYDCVLVQNYGLTAAVLNICRFATRKATVVLVCSPMLQYYACRLYERSVVKLSFILGSASIRLCHFINGLLAQHFIVLSRYLGSVVGVDSNRITVIPVYGVDTNVYCPVTSQRKAAIRCDLGLPLDRFIIIASTRIAPEKDWRTLLGAIQMLDAQADVPRFLVLNLGGGSRRFVRAAEAAGVGHLVQGRDAVNPINLLPRYYQAADLCVQLSNEEGLGFSPLESLACETPVIASRVGGLNETMVDGKTAYTVPPRDAAAVAQLVRQVMQYPQAARQMARRGRLLAIESFNSDQAFDRLVGLLATKSRL